MLTRNEYNYNVITCLTILRTVKKNMELCLSHWNVVAVMCEDKTYILYELFKDTNTVRVTNDIQLCFNPTGVLYCN